MEHVESFTPDVAKPPESVQGWTESFIEAVTQTSLGQTILKVIDQFLWVVEKSAQWSLPTQEIAVEENGKSFGRMELVRPLPWIFFLPGLLILRVIRAGLNVGAFVLGYPQIQPSGMVKFVQKSRRRLRAIKLNGMKNIRRKTHGIKDKRLSMNETKKTLIRSIQLTLSTLSCLDNSKSNPSPPPTKIHISNIDLETTPTPEEKSTTESADSPMHTDGKCKYTQESSDAESSESEQELLQSKITRLAMENSTDDSDFTPAECSTSGSTTTSENTENDISFKELKDIRENALQLDEKVAMDLQRLKVNVQSEKALEKSATGNSDKQEPVSGLQTPDESEFQTPNKYSQDGDTTYYSPISSKSSSPERWASPIERKPVQPSNSLRANDLGNGEINFSSGLTASGTPSQETTNGAVFEKRSPTNTGKSHHKGKHTNHGNRKKK